MNWLVFTVQADGVAFGAAMDSRIGYPKPGVDIGGGFHVPPAQSTTVRLSALVKHPTLGLWAYSNDASVQTEVGKGLAIPVTGSVQVLDSTWIPPVIG